VGEERSNFVHSAGNQIQISFNEEKVKRVKKLVEADHARAFDVLAGYYEQGSYGLPQDYEKANELYLKAGELGCAVAYFKLGYSYYDGSGVEVDKKKTRYYWEQGIALVC